MRRNLSPLAPLLALALAGACNTPGPVADDDDEPGMVDLGPIDDITPETLAMTSSNKPKCPANSKDPGCIKGRNIVSIFRGLDRNVLGARCDQTPGGQMTAVAFDILDPQAVLNQQFFPDVDPQGRSVITVMSSDTAGKKHAVEGVTHRIFLDGNQVAVITIDNKQHAKAKVDKNVAGAGALLALATSPASVFDAMTAAHMLCPNNIVTPPHPSIFTKDHSCALCRVFKGGVLVGLGVAAAAALPEIVAAAGFSVAVGKGIADGAVAAGAAVIAEEFSCETVCKVSECVDKSEDCNRRTQAGAKSCDAQFEMCCMKAGGLCVGTEIDGATCPACLPSGGSGH